MNAVKVSVAAVLAVFAFGVQANPAKPLSDRQITDIIQHRINHSPVLDGDVITVETHQGRVHLTGQVDSRFERHVAKRIALKVPGVKSVKLDLGIIND